MQYSSLQGQEKEEKRVIGGSNRLNLKPENVLISLYLNAAFIDNQTLLQSIE